MKTILVPVDGSDNSLRAVKMAIDNFKANENASLHLVTVQVPIASGNVKSFFSPEAIKGYYEDEGRAALLPAKALLDDAGVPYSEEILIGPIAPTIADYAKKHQCDHLFMGTRGLGSFSSVVLGSVTTKVLSLIDVPVTLVK